MLLYLKKHNSNNHIMNTLKSIGAVLAGFIAIVILHTGTDLILEKAGIFPPPDQGLFITWMLVLALTYRMIFTVAGGTITAAFAPQNPMKHVTILGILGTVGGIGGIFAGWNMSDHWYPIALAVTAFPCVWLGGKLKTR
jgi:hypothetical protein